jgi:hypothetical protein
MKTKGNAHNPTLSLPTPIVYILISFIILYICLSLSRGVIGHLGRDKRQTELHDSKGVIF